MDDESMRNWGYYEPPLKGHLCLQLMSSMVDRDTKSLLSGHHNSFMVSPNGAFHPRDCVVTEPPPVTHMDYVRDGWINHREIFFHMFPPNSYSPIFAETSETHQSMTMPHHTEKTKDVKSGREEPNIKKEASPPSKKRAAPANPKNPKGKRPRKGSAPKQNGNFSVHRSKAAQMKVDVVINGVDTNISAIPIPVCSCTGTPQQCYRWGCGGWQSACCTTTISIYPLPMSTKRRGARIAGRKMSQGAFKKLLEKLASEGYNFDDRIDLRTYWAKHGTNKFVIIR